MMFHNANTMKILEEFHWEDTNLSYPNIHFFIFNYQLDQRATKMLHWFQKNQIQCTLINSIDKTPLKDAVNVPNNLYNGLWNKMVELANTEISFILTSDVTIPDINQLLINTKIFQDKDVIAYSPTIFYSYWNYKKIRKYDEKMDEVPILDGMCYGLRKEIIDHIGKIPLHINKSGWVQEPIMGMYAQKNNKKLIRDNSVIAIHPPHRGYNQQKACQEEITYIKYKNIEKEYLNFKKTSNTKFTRKNVIFVWHEESLTGSVNVIYEIVKYLIYRHAKTHNFYIFSLRKNDTKFHDELHTNYLSDVPGDTLADKVKHIIYTLNPHKVYGNTIDVAHIVKLFKDNKIKTILHCHELEDGFENFQKNVLKSSLNKFIPNAADHFIAVSDGTEKLLKENGVKNIWRIPSFINQNNTKIKAYTLLDIQKSKKRIVGCGTGIIRKGFDRFISLANKLPEYEFIWVGEVFYEQDKIKVLGGCGLSNIYLDKPENLILYGLTDNPYPVIKSADIFLLTSRLDPDPLVVKEALILKVPVITIKESGESWKYTNNYLETYNEEKMIEMLKKDYKIEKDYNFDMDNFIKEIEKLVIEPPKKLYV